MAPTLTDREIAALVGADHYDPFQLLGCHPLGDTGYVIRAIDPEAREAYVHLRGFNARKLKMAKIHAEGLYELVIPATEPFVYDLSFVDYVGNVHKHRDPYHFLPQISDWDLHLFREGNHHRIYDVLGATLRSVDGERGVLFAVWAPDVKAVSVIGDFNHWDPRVHQMRVRGGSGVWELFVPGVGEKAKYKFHIKTKKNNILEKADPYSRFAEYRPRTSSVVYDLEHYAWSDQKWMAERKSHHHRRSPLLIYEVHLGSWCRVPHEANRFMTYRELADKLFPYVKARGFTHIELLPICEHPFDGSWGYQVTGTYAATSRFGTPPELMYFIDQAHQAGIGVILDIVPGHFPKDEHGLSTFTGDWVYEHPDPLRREHPHWGTFCYDFGRNEVRNFLVANPLYWIDKFHIDGIRVDAVASMLYLDYGREGGQYRPNIHGGKENLEAIYFLRQMNELIHRYYPDTLSIAEESTAWPGVTHPVPRGGLGFDFKWNMGWMNDTLEFFKMDPFFRSHHQEKITFAISYAYAENFILTLSHDEVVHGKGSLLGKMPGNGPSKLAHLKLLLGYFLGHPGKKLLFMGGEFGQGREWNHDFSLDWHLLDLPFHRAIDQFSTVLFNLYKSHPCLYEDDQSYGGFEWVDFRDSANSVISFVRQDLKRERHLLFVLNFTPQPLANYRVGALRKGPYRELLNSDASIFGGGNFGNGGEVIAEAVPWQEREWSFSCQIPPLGILIFEPVPPPEKLGGNPVPVGSPVPPTENVIMAPPEPPIGGKE